MKNLIACLICIFIAETGVKAQIVTDIDGNIYNPIEIGTQTWLKENLSVTHYNNGDEIPNITDNMQWSVLTTGAYCDFDNNAGLSSTYGRLYNWFAGSDSRGICPSGWHVATDAEWSVLTDLLDGEVVAGGKLKEVGSLHWGDPNIGATNEVQFTALPGGYRANNEVYIGLHHLGSWWCSTGSSATEGWARGIFCDAINVDRGGYYEKKMGFSVRCIKDETIGMPDFVPDRSIRIYPNPARNVLTISLDDASCSKIEIFNLCGQRVYLCENACYVKEVDVSGFDSGIYLVVAVNVDFRHLLIVE